MWRRRLFSSAAKNTEENKRKEKQQQQIGTHADSSAFSLKEEGKGGE
jgi:hypothetical protein